MLCGSGTAQKKAMKEYSECCTAGAQPELTFSCRAGTQATV